MKKRELQAKILQLVPERGNTTSAEIAEQLGVAPVEVDAAMGSMKTVVSDGMGHGQQYWRRKAA